MSDTKQVKIEKFIDYIDDNFFAEIVESSLRINRDEFKLKLVLLEPATGKNENFTSILYRAKIKIKLNDGSNQTIQVIIKATLDALPPEFNQFNVFFRERRLYEFLIPKFENKLKNVGVEVEFGPKSVKFETDPYEIIVLEDLCFDNYKMEDRKVGVGLDQAKLVYSKLAKFHAASAVHFEKVGNIYSELDRVETTKSLIDPENPHPMYGAIRDIVGIFCDHVKSWPGFENYAGTLDQWDSNKGLTCSSDVANPMRSGFTVLNHGDLWLTNMMFKFEEDKPVDVKLIDYQCPFWGSPACDLICFYVSSIRDDIKIENFDYFIEFYHTELVANLKRLGYEKPIPTLDEIHIDLLEKGAYFGICLLYILFVVKYDGVEELKVEDFVKSDIETKRIMMKKVYEVDNYKNSVKLLLPFLKRRGFLDCMIIKYSPQ